MLGRMDDIFIERKTIGGPMSMTRITYYNVVVILSRESIWLTDGRQLAEKRQVVVTT
jgi:hypothetical protein